MQWRTRFESIANRIFGNMQHVHVLTIRKSGSHLLGRLLDILKIPYDLEHLLYLDKFSLAVAADNPVAVLIRDPRDVVVSGVYWHTDRWLEAKRYGRPLDGIEMDLTADDLRVWNGSEFNEKLSIAIKHEWPLPYSQINREYELAREALQHPKALLVRFEDIVGKSGGGTDERQQQAIINLWKTARMRGRPNLSGSSCSGHQPHSAEAKLAAGASISSLITSNCSRHIWATC
jgi:hypothetical protein